MQAAEEARSFDALNSELCAALLPVLLQRLRGGTRDLLRARAVLLRASSSDTGSEFELERAGTTTAELGWCLGWISRGLGADLLIGRHERRALEWLARWVDAALRLERRGIARGSAPWPELSPSGSIGEALLAGIAGLWWRAAQSLPEGQELEWSLEPRSGGAASLFVGAGPGLDARVLAERVPGSRLETNAVGLVWLLPAGLCEWK